MMINDTISDTTDNIFFHWNGIISNSTPRVARFRVTLSLFNPLIGLPLVLGPFGLFLGSNKTCWVDEFMQYDIVIINQLINLVLDFNTKQRTT